MAIILEGGGGKALMACSLVDELFLRLQAWWIVHSVLLQVGTCTVTTILQS